MSFAYGDLITADGLNIVNAGLACSGTLSGGADYIQDSIGREGLVFSFRPSGSLLFHCRLDCGWFGGGRLVVKYSTGGYNIFDTTYSWNTHTDVSINSVGPGIYSIRSETPWQFDPVSWQIYLGKTNCEVGKRIRYCPALNTSYWGWDTPESGAQLTAAVLNTGKCYTE